MAWKVKQKGYQMHNSFEVTRIREPGSRHHSLRKPRLAKGVRYSMHRWSHRRQKINVSFSLGCHYRWVLGGFGAVGRDAQATHEEGGEEGLCNPIEHPAEGGARGLIL